MCCHCKGCQNRYIGCHDRCKAYQEFKQSLKQKQDKGDSEYMGYLQGALHRMKGKGSLRRSSICRI